MQVTSGIQCNLLSPSYSTIYAPQGDAQSRFVLIQLLEGATPWEVPAGASVIIRAAKPDGTFCFYDTNEAEESAYSVSGSTVTIELVGQVLAAPGPVLMQVDFYNADGAHLSTFTFCCQVSESVVSDEDIVSSDYFSVLTATLTEMQQIEQAVKAAYGAPLVAATAAAMTDHTRVYVYTGSESGYINGNWYYWNGTAWASGGVYNSSAINVDSAPTEGSTNPVSSGGTYAADAALESELDDVKIALDDISEDVPKTEVTAGLNSTRYGVTFRRVDADTVETFGNGNAARRVLWLNGQDAGMTTTSAFSQTLPAGKYDIEIETIGISGGATIQYTYTTFASPTQIYLAGSGRKSISIEFTAPVMIGIGVSSGTAMGTEESPGQIFFRATQLTAVDKVARAAIKTPDIKIACFGDSITWGRDGSSSSGAQAPTTIPDILAERLNAVCVNYGVGSQGYVATGSGGNAYDNISSKDLSDVDVVMLAYGVNDGYSDLGAADSTDEATIMGQFNKILTYLYTQYPTIRVIVVAPWNGSNVGSAPDYWYGPRSHSAGYVSRKILSDTLKTRCDYYWIPYIEVYDSPVNPFTIQAALPDGVHPRAAYYLQIGRWLAAKIGTIL